MILALEEEKQFLKWCLKERGKLSDRRIIGIEERIPELDFRNFIDFQFTRNQPRWLNDAQIDRIESIQRDIDIREDHRETIIRFLTKLFVNRQLEILEEIELDKIMSEMNPFLITMLKMRTPREVIEYKIRESITRKISTSLGFWFEKFLVFGHSNSKLLKGTGYDAEKILNGTPYWFELKSGPNDVDSTQVKKYNTEFNRLNNDPREPKLAWLYGKREQNSTSRNHARLYLDNWEERVLEGADVWELFSEEPNYHRKVFRWMREASDDLEFESIAIIERQIIERLILEFQEKYGEGEEGVENFTEQSL